MSRKLLLRIVVILVITNVATLFLWSKDKTYIQDTETGVRIYSKQDVATINDKRVTYDDWLHSMQGKYGRIHLKSMIDREIVSQLAEEKGIIIPEKMIDRELALLVTMQGVMDEDELRAQKNYWRDDIIYRYQLEALLADDLKISEDEIYTFYEDYSKQYDFIPMIQISHIVVETIDIAQKVIDELEEGALFPFLAEEYSIDQETKSHGGYLGFYSERSEILPSIYHEAIVEMEVDSFSKPLTINEGVALVYLHDYLPEITFTYDELKPFINNELALKRLGFTHSADVFWKEYDIEWVFER